MRIRSIKPEFWRSRHVAQLPWDLRLIFVGLWSYVDDNGVGLDDPWQITADVFPVEADPVATRQRVEEALEHLSREVREPSPHPLIVRYEVDGRRYLYITGWSHQRIDKPSRARYPGPPEGALTSATITPLARAREESRSGPEKIPTGTGEQGNRGTVKRTPRGGGGYTPEFEQWWAIYPKRNGSKGSKFEASKSWAKAITLASVDALMAATKRYADSPRVREGFPKDGVVWLNQRCWEEFTSPGSSGESVADWLKAEWRAGRVRHIEERAGLHYPQPDLPLDLPQSEAERWLIGQCREWIAANHDLIIERVSGRESA